MLTTFYLTKNDHRWVSFIFLKTIKPAGARCTREQEVDLENPRTRPELDVRLLDEDLQLLEALVLRHALLRDGHEVPVELVLMLGDDAVARLVPKDTNK